MIIEENSEVVPPVACLSRAMASRERMGTLSTQRVSLPFLVKRTAMIVTTTMTAAPPARLTGSERTREGTARASTTATTNATVVGNCLSSGDGLSTEMRCSSRAHIDLTAGAPRSRRDSGSAPWG